MIRFSGGPKKDLQLDRGISILLFMISQSTKRPANDRMIELLRAALAEILAEVLKRGYHGTAGIELSVQDGTIQHIRRNMEKTER